MPELKDGTEPEDPRLDRLVEFDERSRRFSVATRLDEIAGEKPQRSYTWRCNPRLDQGQEGSCVGHGIAHELAARPSEVQGMTHEFAKNSIYYEAQKIDPWPGGEYPGASPRYGGTSVLAGVKVTQRLGYFESYHWSFSLQELILGVGYSGPAVMGMNWYEGMYRTDSAGFVYPSGDRVGGHCFLTRGVDVRNNRFLCRNSWGINWGMAGDFFLRFEDMDRLIHERGEACFFTGRRTIADPQE